MHSNGARERNMRTRHGNLTQKARQLLSRHCHCHCFRGPAPSILLVWRRRLDKISDCGPSQFRPPAGCCSELLIYLRPNSCEQLRALRQLPACRSSTATSTFFSGSTPIQVWTTTDERLVITREYMAAKASIALRLYRYSCSAQFADTSL